MNHVTQMARSLQSKMVSQPEGREALTIPTSLTPDIFSRRSSSSARDVIFTLPPLLSPDIFWRRSSSATELRTNGWDGSHSPLSPCSPRDHHSDCASRTSTPSPFSFITAECSPPNETNASYNAPPSVYAYPKSPTRKGLGRLNPDMYRLPSSDNDDSEVKATLGRLWFSVSYDASEEKLTITVIKAKKLPPRCRDEPDSCDPVIRVHLLPDKRRYLQSQQKKNTCNPRFDEEFSFMIPQRRLSEHSIRISVYDSRRDRKHVPLGAVSHSLQAGTTIISAARDICRVEEDGDSNCSNGSSVPGPKAAKAPVAASVGTVGGLLVGLTYNAGLNRLNVAILEAVELESVDDGEPPATYAKVTMYHNTRGLKSKRTTTVRDSCHPKYAESFNMSLPGDNLSGVHIRVQVKQKMWPGRKDVALGGVTFGSHMFARGLMQEHWEKMLQNPKEQIQMWHVLKAL